MRYVIKKRRAFTITKIYRQNTQFGDIGIDDALVRKKFETKEEIFEMNNGCICCKVRGDLIKILGKILTRDDSKKFDAIVIETTGLADPSPVAQTFFVDEKIRYRSRLDAIITVVDAKHILMHLDEKKAKGVENEAVEQVVFADRLLINKIDLVDEKMLSSVKSRLRKLNPHAKQLTCSRSKVPLKEILNIRSFDLDHILETCDPDFLGQEEEENHNCTGDACTHHDHDHDHHHSADHIHDTSIRSVGIKFVGELEMDSLNKWIADLLKSRGKEIYRMKGVFAIKDLDSKFVFQGVHMLLDSEPMEGVTWAKNEVKMNKCIFIGRNLDKNEIEKGLRKCLA
jgi:G3E family GTPase